MSERKYWFWPVPPPKPSMREIATGVAEQYGLTLDELRSPCRARRYSIPRQEAYALIHATGRFSLPQIGRFFRKCDHTAVWHGVRAHQARQQAAQEIIAA